MHASPPSLHAPQVAKALLADEEFDAPEVEKGILADWNADSCGQTELTREMFMDALCMPLLTRTSQA